LEKYKFTQFFSAPTINSQPIVNTRYRKTNSIPKTNSASMVPKILPPSESPHESGIVTPPIKSPPAFSRESPGTPEPALSRPRESAKLSIGIRKLDAQPTTQGPVSMSNADQAAGGDMNLLALFPPPPFLTMPSINDIRLDMRGLQIQWLDPGKLLYTDVRRPWHDPLPSEKLVFDRVRGSSVYMPRRSLIVYR